MGLGLGPLLPRAPVGSTAWLPGKYWERGGTLWVSAPGCGVRQSFMAPRWTHILVQGGLGVDLPGLECLGDPLAPVLPSLKGKEGSHLLARCNRNCHPLPRNLGLQNSEPRGEMKGWLANHSENSFAKAKQGPQGPSLPPAEGTDICRLLSCWNWSCPPLGLGAWSQLPAAGFLVFQPQSSPLLNGSNHNNIVVI